MLWTYYLSLQIKTSYYYYFCRAEKKSSLIYYNGCVVEMRGLRWNLCVCEWVRLTLRTDTRQMQGSKTPVAGLALILHTKENFFRQRTQFSWTSCLWRETEGELVISTITNLYESASETLLRRPQIKQTKQWLSMLINKWPLSSFIDDFSESLQGCISLRKSGQRCWTLLCSLFTGTNRSSTQQSIFVRQQDFAQEMRTLRNRLEHSWAFSHKWS